MIDSSSRPAPRPLAPRLPQAAPYGRNALRAVRPTGAAPYGRDCIDWTFIICSTSSEVQENQKKTSPHTRQTHQLGKVTEHQTSVTADVVTRTTKGRWSDVGVGAGRRADGLTEDDENEADRPTERTNEGRQSALRAACANPG